MYLKEPYRTTARSRPCRAENAYPLGLRVISGQRYLHTELGRWTRRDPIEELQIHAMIDVRSARAILRHAGAMPRGILTEIENLYQFTMNAPLDHIDLLGFTCPHERYCDKWELICEGQMDGTILGIAVAGASCVLKADISCCMGPHSPYDWMKRYNYLGVGVGVGLLPVSLVKFEDATHAFETSCITWEDHEGRGSFIGGGIGIGVVRGRAKFGMPQDNWETDWSNDRGWDFGLIATLGRWKVHPLWYSGS